MQTYINQPVNMLEVSMIYNKISKSTKKLIANPLVAVQQ